VLDDQMCVWSKGGMIQTGKNGSTRRKTGSIATLHHFGLNPRLCGNKWKIFGTEFIEKNKNI
jgi:hypothetical protein